jgi:predicted dehydrogenase
MSRWISRRSFFDRTALGLAGLAASAAAPPAQPLGPNERIVVGVMGLSRGYALAEGFAAAPGVEVRYLCDVDADRAGRAADAFEKRGAAKPQAIGDFRRVLDDSEVDALVCAAPNHWHSPATILACAAGKHVYVEKPCSHNPREGEWMVEAARKHRRAVQVGTQRRSSAGIRAAIDRLLAGEIGKVYSARAYYASARASIGTGKEAPVPPNLDYDLWQGPAPRRPYIDNLIHYNWHWFWHWGNGELGNNGVHTLDLCRWGLGVDFPIRVTSIGGRYCFDDDQETPDTHAVAFEFEGGKLITWDGQSCHPRSTGFVTFYGDKGSLDLEDQGGYALRDLEDGLVVSEKGTLGQPEHIENFLSAIRDDQPQRLNAEVEEGHKSALLCHLGNIAQRTGRTLHCDANTGRILDDREAMGYWEREYEPGWAPRV